MRSDTDRPLLQFKRATDWEKMRESEEVLLVFTFTFFDFFRRKLLSRGMSDVEDSHPIFIGNLARPQVHRGRNDKTLCQSSGYSARAILPQARCGKIGY